MLGSSITIRDPSAATTKRATVVETAPNAPLLMRLVRHPYEMSPVRFGRIEHREDAGLRHRHEPLGPALAYRAELRSQYQLANPITEHPHRPEDRQPPFMRARRASAERRAMAWLESSPVSERGHE